jgi:DNA modification methylase
MARSTSTRNFGVGARESHDASAFYARFTPKSISTEEELAAPFELAEPLICGDSRTMAELPDCSVALVVTSPPYFAGKEYEEALGEGLIPASYAEYLEMLAQVFAECRRVLEPGGRIAVNVANLGRKPYRSLSADVVRILDDDLGMLLRGEIVWRKADGASGSCAWGSYRSPTNPVLRDITERIIVASKGRFDRAIAIEQRRAQGRPHQPTISTDEFLEATLDVWEIRPESARRVGHPAPFPIGIPQRLIELYTFRDDLVLDPFCGSGSAAVAALRMGRRYVGYDADPTYVEIARERVAAERASLVERAEERSGRFCLPELAPVGLGQRRWLAPATATGPVAIEQARAARVVAVELLAEAGFDVVARDLRIPGVGVVVSIVAEDARHERWHFDVTGAFTSTPAGLVRIDTLLKSLGRASILSSSGVEPVVLLSSHLPPRRSSGDQALRRVGPSGVHDVVSMLDSTDRARLSVYATGGYRARPLPGFWAASELRHGR